MTAEREDTIERLHRDVDEAAARLRELHGGRLHCRPGCSSCCIDDITVSAVEAEHIRLHHRGLLEQGIPHEAGACAFLDEAGVCRIYAHRPYVCRTQGLPLRWLDEDEHGNAADMRDICPQNSEGTPVEDLPQDACWAIGPFEDRLMALQHRRRGASMSRVSLRTMFGKE